jgi:hypothetical protein
MAVEGCGPASAGRYLAALVTAFARWLGVVLLSAVVSLAAWSAGRTDATRLAQNEPARIRIAATIQAAPASQIALRIEVGPMDAIPKNSFIQVRGLPPYVSLSEGHAIAPGAWAIPLFATASLKANVPAGAAGQHEVVVALVSIDGTPLAEARTSLLVAPSFPPPARRPEPGFAATARPMETMARDSEQTQRIAAQGERFIAQGEQYLTEGNMAVARQFFQRAADLGYAPGAMRLATTYDPIELSRLHVQGIAPDPEQARRWYERARELGAPDADERLAKLRGP